MKELLDLNRREFVAARWYMDEETSQTVNVLDEVQRMNFDRFMELRSFVTQTQKDLCVRYVAIGCALLEIKRSKLYHYVAPTGNGDVGYGSFVKFCKDVFGIAKTTVERMVAIAENFATAEGTLDVKYLPYSYSQLAELLSIDKKYRAKITSKCSTRDIRHLGDLYKKEPPSEDTTVEKDLERWREIHEEEQAKKNARKNALKFVPARKSDATLGDTPAPGCGKNVSVEDEFDGEDERDLSTPTVEKNIPFEAIRNGLLRQLELLRTCDVGVAWKKCADIFEEALNAKAPIKVARYKDLVAAKIEIANLKEKMAKGTGPITHNGLSLPPAQKLTLKNAKERKEWLEGYESWPVWLDVPEVSKTFYRYDFINGAALIIEVGVDFWEDWQHKNKLIRKRYVHYAIIDDSRTEYDSAYQGGASGIVEWLTKHAKEI